jgi:hypothetical protein
MVHVVACGEERFIDAASYPADDFTKADLDRFLTGLPDDLSFVKEIRFYGGVLVDVPSSVISRVKRVEEIDYPPFLEWVDGFSIKPFRVKTVMLSLHLNRTVLLRFALYAVLAYGLMLFLTLGDYDKALMDLKHKAILVENKIDLLQRDVVSQENPDMINNLEAIINKAISPLEVLDLLAVGLPEESHAKSLIVNNGIVDLIVSARDPLSVIRRLGSSERVDNVTLKGSPRKENSTGAYSFSLLLEIKP